jgi:hypothetical protein
MPEQVFEHHAEWDQLAKTAREAIDAERSGTWSDTARTAVAALKGAMTPALGPGLADWAVSRWILTKQPLRTCIRAEVADQRPWPSQPRV